MNKFRVKLAITATAVSLFFSNLIVSQVNRYSPKELPPATKAARVRITQGPELELANDKSAIIRRTSNNPGGSPEHFGIVHFCTNPKVLSQTAKSHIQFNHSPSYTVFRVRVEDLAPPTKYYY